MQWFCITQFCAVYKFEFHETFNVHSIFDFHTFRIFVYHLKHFYRLDYIKLVFNHLFYANFFTFLFLVLFCFVILVFVILKCFRNIAVLQIRLGFCGNAWGPFTSQKSFFCQKQDRIDLTDLTNFRTIWLLTESHLATFIYFLNVKA